MKVLYLQLNSLEMECRWEKTSEEQCQPRERKRLLIEMSIWTNIVLKLTTFIMIIIMSAGKVFEETFTLTCNQIWITSDLLKKYSDCSHPESEIQMTSGEWL